MCVSERVCVIVSECVRVCSDGTAVASVAYVVHRLPAWRTAEPSVRRTPCVRLSAAPAPAWPCVSHKLPPAAAPSLPAVSPSGQRWPGAQTCSLPWHTRFSDAATGPSETAKTAKNKKRRQSGTSIRQAGRLAHTNRLAHTHTHTHTHMRKRGILLEYCEPLVHCERGRRLAVAQRRERHQRRVTAAAACPCAFAFAL